VGKRVRPVVAALLALAIAGLGHVYLRSWGRAAGWFAMILGGGLALAGAFAEPGVAVSELPPVVVYPLVGLFILSAVDAYLIARRSRAAAAGTHAGDVAVPGFDRGAGEPTCPHCGHEIDPTLDFCHWCTEPLDRDPVPESDADRNSDGLA